MPLTCTYEEFIARVDADSEDMTKDKEQLFEYVKAGHDQFGGETSAELTWRLGRAIYKQAAVAEVAGDKKKLLQLVIEAEKQTRRAVEMDDNCSNAHVWLATVLGKRCDMRPCDLSSKDRIASGKEVQQHLDRAIEIHAEDYVTFYTYGRWCYEVASLTWVERKLAAVMFGTPPDASYTDAMDKFRTVQKLKPEWKANLFWIAKTAVALKDYATAIQMADEAAAVPSVDEEDVVCESDITAIQKKYAGYRSVKSG